MEEGASLPPSERLNSTGWLALRDRNRGSGAYIKSEEAAQSHVSER